MEVTRKNFRDVLESVSEAIEESSFLAIDGEFTGLHHAGMSNAGVFDTPEDRYQKLLQGASDFLLIQFGLCAFSYDEQKKVYTAKPFNFYTFPRPHSRSAPDVRFACQSSSIDFLCGQGFDFNKVFHEGISYLRPAEEARLKEGIQKKHESLLSPSVISPAGGGSQSGPFKGPVDVPAEHKDFIDGICKQVDKFLESGEQDQLPLASCTAYQRKLTYQTLQTKYSNEVHLQSKTRDNKERYIIVTRVRSEDEMKKVEADKQAQDLAEIEAAVGFTHVVKMISQSGKLVVGHNMMLDLIHTIHQFLYPLPQDYTDFKSMCRCVFPRLLDTKLMANTQPFKERIENSGLGNLHLIISSNAPFVKPAVVIGDGFDNRYTTSESLHEAAYDAYITGQCFISLADFLGTYASPPVDRVPPVSPLLEPFLNKLFMMRVTDIPYMDLASPDLTPSRDHVFHITFPVEWKMTDISQLFGQFGTVHVSWETETSAFVALHSRSAAVYVMKTLCKKGSAYHVLPYQDYKDQLRYGRQDRYHYHRAQGRFVAGAPVPDPPASGAPAMGPLASIADVPAEPPRPTKRSLSPVCPMEEGEKKRKLLNVDAPVFESRITPNTTPEKDDSPQWPHNGNSSDKKKAESPIEDDKMFAEPSDW